MEIQKALKIIQPQNITSKGIIVATSTKLLGNMAFDQPRNHDNQAANNLNQFLKLLGLKSYERICLFMVNPKHSCNVALLTFHKLGRIIVSKDNQAIIKLSEHPLPEDYKLSLPDANQGIDALICNRPNSFLGLLHADCAPICLYDPQTNYFALIHAGAVGALNGIILNTLNVLEKDCRVQPRNILAYIGPCISGKNYNITLSIHWPVIKKQLGHEIAAKLDLKTIIKIQLLAAGLKSENIETSEICTAENDMFFSNHKSSQPAQEGRNMTIIGI